MYEYCKNCGKDYLIEQSRSELARCENCGKLLKRAGGDHSALSRAYLAVALVVLVLSVICFKNEIVSAVAPAYAMKNMSPGDMKVSKQNCLRNDDHECLVRIFQRQLELDPSDNHSKANLAMRLTSLRRFTQAAPIYNEILSSGVGTYDLMAFYAQNFKGLGQTDQAIKWYEKSLEIQPNLVDVIEDLAKLYVEKKRPAEAVSILSSFIDSFPSAEGMLSGNVIASQELFENTATPSSLRLTGLSGSHFGLPLQLGGKSKSEIFLVDTGASYLTLPTEDVDKYWPGLKETSKAHRAKIATGEVIAIRVMRVPQVRLGDWIVKNVEIAYCDKCSRLAGMSFLYNFKMETDTRGGLSTLTLTPVRSNLASNR